MPIGDQASGEVSTSPLPVGTVTFLLTDIEGSTRLWEHASEAMDTAVVSHYEILYAAIARHDGARPVEQGEGDSVVGAFSRASDAVAAALEAQRKLHAHPWPDGLELRVRIALHTADAQLRDENNYSGLALSRSARLRAIAHGGQILLSNATRDLVVDALPDGVELVDCGTHRLRDLGRPEHVFALVNSGFGEGVGALRSLDTFPNNLPDQLTSFVGRAHELAQLREALAETRLLTLTGAGGAGKTRLALQLAADALEQFVDGAWWVDLAPVADARLVGEVLAGALGVRPLPMMTPLQASCAHLAGTHALVVVDNCEHLLEACAEMIDAVLRACPQVVVVATSRAPLGVAGETDWRVPSLSLPEPQREPESLDVLGRYDAVRLFLERARKARPNFTVTSDNAPAVAQVCQEVDGLPLAIELAAARVRMMSAQQIAAGLEDRFHLLTGGARTALPRQQTLRASVDWSHELLSEPEQVMLRRLAVFAGGFTLDLVEAACADERLEGVAILDLITSLVDKSLVVAEEHAGEVRYRLLETVRQYGLERLITSGEAAGLRDRHRDAMLELAERIAPELHGPGQQGWLDVLDQEAANLAAALDHAARTDPERALRLCVALTFWWKGRGLFTPAERGFAQALEAGDPTPSSLRAHALWGRGYLALYAGRYEAALVTLQQTLAVAEEVGDQSALARALMAVGSIEMFRDPDESRPINERARELARRCSDDWTLIISTINLATVHCFRCEFREAERLVDETLPLSQTHGYLELQAWHWFERSLGPWAAADGARLTDHTERVLAFARAAGEPTTEVFAQGLRAHLELARGDADAALRRMRAAHARALTAGAGLALGWAVTWLALAQAGIGELAEARAALEQAISTGIDGGIALGFATVSLADVLRVAGELAAAEACAGEALAIAEHTRMPPQIALAKEILGRVAAGRGDWARAEALVYEALTIRVDDHLLLWVPQTFDALAEVAAGLERYEDASRTLGIAHRSRRDLSLERWTPDVLRFAQLEHTLREWLGGDSYEHAYTDGQQLSLEEAIAWIRGTRAERTRPAPSSRQSADAG